jgi:hypothetical protein
MKKHIDLINAYINNTLSKTERLVFENRIAKDQEFSQLYNEQLAFLEGVKRVDLKAQINAAKQSFVRAKWLKYIGVPVGIIVASVIIYSFIFKSKTPQIAEPINNNEIEMISDSLTIEKLSEDKIEEQITVAEQSESELIEKKEVIATSQKKTRNDKTIEEIVTKKTILKAVQQTSSELIAFFKSVKKTPQIIEVNTEKDFTVTCKEGTVLTIPTQSFVDVKTGELTRGIINLEVTEFFKLSDMLLANLTTKSEDKILETGGMLYLDANKNGEKLKLKESITISFPDKMNKAGMQLFAGEENNNRVNWKLRSNKSDIIFSKDSSLNVIERISGDDYDRTLWIKEIMLDSTLIVTDEFYNSVLDYEERKLIRRLQDYSLQNRKVIIRKELLELKDSPFKIHPQDSISRGGHIIRKPLELKQKRLSRVLTARTPSAEDDKYNVFKTSKLGWINCDRFVKSKKRKIKYKLKIKNAEGADVKLVFKSVSSILPSNKQNDYYDFGKVPIDEAITIIAIKEKNGKLFLSIQESKTEAKPKIEFNFEKVTVKELKKKLETLNGSF